MSMEKKKTTEVVLHYDEILKILKKEVAEKAHEFLGLTYKQRNEMNVVCLDQAQIIIPQEGIRFTAVESPVDM